MAVRIWRFSALFKGHRWLPDPKRRCSSVCQNFRYSVVDNEYFIKYRYSTASSIFGYHEHPSSRPFNPKTGFLKLPTSTQTFERNNRNLKTFSSSANMNLKCATNPVFRCHSRMLLLTRFLHTSRRVWAGHNKWSKVKHIKGPKDHQRSLLFNKLVLQMKFAIKEGGPKPEINSALASVIGKAKANEMPKTTIEGIIKNAIKKGSDADTKLIYEVRGPGQSCLLIDVLTDNPRRTRMEIQYILQKNGGEFATTLYAFRQKGVVRVLPQSEGQDRPLTLDLATEVAIEVGAEDVQETSSEDDAPLFMFICDMTDLRTVRNNLTSLNYTVESSSFEYLPETTSTLNDTHLADAFQLISLLNDNPNVVRIYDNVESSN